MKTEDVDLVWNISGTSLLRNYGKSYRKRTGSKCNICSIKGCSGTSIVGAHMTDGTYVYLIPICQSCNHYTNTSKMQLKGGRNIAKIGLLNKLEMKILELELKKLGI